MLAVIVTYLQTGSQIPSSIFTNLTYSEDQVASDSTGSFALYNKFSAVLEDALKETMENKATTFTVTPYLRSAAYDYAKATGVKLD